MPKLNTARIIGTLGVLATIVLAIPSSADTVTFQKVKTSDKQQKAVLDFVKGAEPGTSVNPKTSGVRPKLTAGVKRLTPAQCTGLGGVVIDNNPSCASNQVCSTTDPDGVVRRVCITATTK
jgi:hypothetical protein